MSAAKDKTTALRAPAESFKNILIKMGVLKRNLRVMVKQIAQYI